MPIQQKLTPTVLLFSNLYGWVTMLNSRHTTLERRYFQIKNTDDAIGGTIYLPKRVLVINTPRFSFCLSMS